MDTHFSAANEARRIAGEVRRLTEALDRSSDLSGKDRESLVSALHFAAKDLEGLARKLEPCRHCPVRNWGPLRP